MSKASEYASIMQAPQNATRPVLPKTGVSVSDTGKLECAFRFIESERVPELVAWLINIFDVKLPLIQYQNQSADDCQKEAELLRRKLARAMETLGEYEIISFDGRNMASRAIAEIEAME